MHSTIGKNCFVALIFVKMVTRLLTMEVLELETT